MDAYLVWALIAFFVIDILVALFVLLPYLKAKRDESSSSSSENFEVKDQ